MKIAVIGPGSMGLLYGTKLSKCAEVYLIGNNKEHVKEINEHGVTVKRGDNSETYEMKAVVSGEFKEPVDLIVLFTKAYVTHEALLANKDIIGKETVILTLQNGAGHEDILKEFTDEEHILIGTTTQGSYRENPHTIVNSGLGDTTIGSLKPSQYVDDIAELFEKAGFPCKISDNIKFAVWNKLMINASSSVLSGVLGTNQGYVAENDSAWEICCSLIREICDASSCEGCVFNADEQIDRIKKHLEAAPGGYTSIYSDLQNGRKTEVDYISGAVVRAAVNYGKAAPNQDMMVKLVHAMESKGVNK